MNVASRFSRWTRGEGAAPSRRLPDLPAACQAFCVSPMLPTVPCSRTHNFTQVAIRRMDRGLQQCVVPDSVVIRGGRRNLPGAVRVGVRRVRNRQYRRPSAVDSRAARGHSQARSERSEGGHVNPGAFFPGIEAEFGELDSFGTFLEVPGEGFIPGDMAEKALPLGLEGVVVRHV